MTEEPPGHAAGAPRPMRHTDRARIPRKVDRPTPAPLDIVLDRPRRAAARRKPTSRPRRWARGMRRALRTRKGKWALVALACALVLLVGLLTQGFLSSSAPSDVPPGAAGSGAPGGTAGAAASTPPASPGPSPSKSTTAAAGPVGGNNDDVLRTLRSRFPNNPLNSLKGAPVHEVTIEARSAGTFPVLGWLVPTGLGNTYGKKNNASGTWTLTQRAVGKGYLAAVFLQAGRAGTPVTCRVIVDGKVTNTETTSGSYGRTVCVG